MTRIYHPGYINGKWQVVSTSDGINDRRNEGPRWNTGKEARDYVDRMEALEVVSPLRARSAGDSAEGLGGLLGDAHQQNEVDRQTPAITSEAVTGGFTPVGPEVRPPGLWPD